MLSSWSAPVQPDFPKIIREHGRAQPRSLMVLREAKTFSLARFGLSSHSHRCFGSDRYSTVSAGLDCTVLYPGEARVPILRRAEWRDFPIPPLPYSTDHHPQLHGDPLRQYCKSTFCASLNPRSASSRSPASFPIRKGIGDKFNLDSRDAVLYCNCSSRPPRSLSGVAGEHQHLRLTV